MTDREPILSFGHYAVGAYFSLFYLLPLAILTIVGPHPTLAYEGDAFLLATVVTFCLTLAYLVSRLDIGLPIRFLASLPNVFEMPRLIALIAVVSLPIAYQFFQQYGAGFRYSGVGQKAAGFGAQYLLLYKGFFFAYVLYTVCRVYSLRSLGTRYRLALFLSCLVWLLAANGSSDIAVLLVALVIAVFGDSAKKILVSQTTDDDRRGPVFLKSLTRWVGAGVLSVAAAFGVIFFGFANKVGFEDVWDRFTPENLAQLGMYLYYRISLLLAPVEGLARRGVDWQVYTDSWNALWDTFVYRAQSLSGVGANKPELGGLNQLNYYEIFREPTNNRSGSSPGVIASFLYLPVFPLNLILSGVYIGAIVVTYNRAVREIRGQRPSILTMLVMVFLSFYLLHSPFELFFKIGPELFAGLFFLYSLQMCCESHGRNSGTVKEPIASGGLARAGEA